jgi:hypothetical protein
MRRQKAVDPPYPRHESTCYTRAWGENRRTLSV